MNKATTLEAHHQSRIRGLDSERERITDLQRELQEKKVAVNNVGSHTDEWRNLNDQIDELQRRIVSLKNDDDRLNYFLDVGDMLFQYFEAQESVAKGHMPRRGGTAVNLPANSVLSYFASEAPGSGSGSSVSGSSSASYTTDKYAATEETAKIRKINVEEGMNRDKMLEKYLAVIDLNAEYYLQTIKVVFQEQQLAKGTMRHRGRLVEPKAIRNTALMTVEGENDDISGIGQTQAAHDLCVNIPAANRVDYIQAGVGHYGVFNGSRFRAEIAPRIRDFIRSHNRP